MPTATAAFTTSGVTSAALRIASLPDASPHSSGSLAAEPRIDSPPQTAALLADAALIPTRTSARTEPTAAAPPTNAWAGAIVTDVRDDSSQLDGSMSFSLFFGVVVIGFVLLRHLMFRTRRNPIEKLK